MAAQPGERVWIRHATEVWEPAVVDAVDGLTVQVHAVGGARELVFGDAASLEDDVKRRNEGDIATVDDLVKLPFLHEPAILHVLRRRAANGLIYTNVGAILLAVNPFKRLPELYGDRAIETQRTAGALRAADPEAAPQPPPHCFAVADQAYRQMRSALMSNKPADQAILISGESGAGKTETTKFVMRYLAGLSAGGNSLQGLEARVLQTNPVLEGFGNARTLRNDNSSRFGKWISLDFDERGRLARAGLRTYLLEKVRLVRQTEGERGFHVFYEALASKIDNWPASEKDSVCVSGSSRGVNGRDDGVLDADSFQERIRALRTLGLDDAGLKSALATLAAVLHLGAVRFVKEHKASQDHGSSVDPATKRRLTDAADALRVDSAALENALCKRTVKASGDALELHLAPNAAARSRDALLKAIYGALFDDLVRSCNRALSNEKPSKASIGLLDIFGFEIFATNSFEQLLINYTNERLQAHFNTFVFESEQKLYEEEGLQWDSVDFPNNAAVLALIEGSKRVQSPAHRGTLPSVQQQAAIGLLATIDDECLLVAGRADAATSDAVTDDLDERSARTLGTRLKKTFNSEARYACDAKQERGALFSVHHYAGPVEYSVRGFVAKNMDALPPDAQQLLATSAFANAFEVATATAVSPDRKWGAGRRVTGRRASSLATTTVAQRFRTSLGALLLEIRATCPHFIRCLKPNDANVPDVLEAPRLVEQLRYCGVLEAVRVARAGYPVRLLHAEFARRYRSAAPSGYAPPNLEDALVQTAALSAANALVRALAPGAGLRVEPATTGDRRKGVAVGKTKVFLRKDAFEALEALLARRTTQAAVRVQKTFRGRHARRYLRSALRVALFAQRHARRKLRVRRRAVLRIMGAVRVVGAARRFRAARKIALYAQTGARGTQARRKLGWLRDAKAVRKLQRVAQRGEARGSFHRLRSACITLQCLARIQRAKEAKRHEHRLRRDASLVLVDLRKAEVRAENVRAEMAAAVAAAKLAKATHDEKCQSLDLELRRQATARVAARAEVAAVRAERDAALKALQAERDLRTSANDPQLKTVARDAAHAQGTARAVMDACAQDSRDAAARASTSQAAKSALDAEAGRAAVAATEAARRCADVEKKANRAAARFAERSGRQAQSETFSEDGTVMTPLASDDRRALDAARDASRLAREALQAARATRDCRALRARAARRLADDARQLQADDPPPPPFDLGMAQPVDDSDGEFPEEADAASPGLRRARRRVLRLRDEIGALRRLVCGGWMAQWRMLCELGEDPVPQVEEEGPATPSGRGGLDEEDSFDVIEGGGPRVDPAALAGRFAADISALDAATAQLAGNAADGETAPYAAALAETLLKMERASGCLRALAAIEVAPWTPLQLREQLDAAYGRLEDMSSRRGSVRRATPTRRPPNGTPSASWVSVWNCGAFGHRDEPAADEA